MKSRSHCKILFLLPVLLALAPTVLTAQAGYKTGDKPADFPVAKILNHSTGSSSLAGLNDRLLILDFFGTWCAPCIRALPKLTSLQQRYPDQIRIVLVSDEPEEKLQAFIKQRADFSLPVVVDESKQFTQAFQPPAYPYTIVMNRAGKIIAIPAQEQLYEATIGQWLADSAVSEMSPQITEMPLIKETQSSGTEPASGNVMVNLSAQLMYAAKTGGETKTLQQQLASVNFNDLQTQLDTDAGKKAFWINLYNAFTQIALKENPDQFKNRGRFFRGKQFIVAGKHFSLDDIEHGILRRSRVKWSLGYFGKLFPGKTEKSLRVERIDYRIHFALNCGAKSCPPIAFYTSENLDKQLDQATRVYLSSEAEYDSVKNVLHLPALMGWFRGDFGGKASMRRMVNKPGILPAGKKPSIRFKPYDWTLYLQHYN